MSGEDETIPELIHPASHPTLLLARQMRQRFLRISTIRRRVVSLAWALVCVVNSVQLLGLLLLRRDPDAWVRLLQLALFVSQVRGGGTTGPVVRSPCARWALPPTIWDPLTWCACMRLPEQGYVTLARAFVPQEAEPEPLFSSAAGWPNLAPLTTLSSGKGFMLSETLRLAIHVGSHGSCQRLLTVKGKSAGFCADHELGSICHPPDPRPCSHMHCLLHRLR